MHAQVSLSRLKLPGASEAHHIPCGAKRLNESMKAIT